MAKPPFPLNPHNNLQTNQGVLALPLPRSLPSSSHGGHHGFLPLPTQRAMQSSTSRGNHGGVLSSPKPQSVPSPSRTPPPLPNATLVASPPVIHGSRGRGESASTSFGKEASVQRSAQARAAGRACSDRLPPSYRFIPTEEELISHHLLNHVWGRPTGVKCVHTVAFYDYSPDQLTAMHDKSDVGIWYFFARLSWKYANANPVKRTAGDGYWKRVGSRQPILRKMDNVQIGTKQDFDFYRGQPSGRKGIITNWAMHEYRMSDFMAQRYLPPRIVGEDEKMGEWVLCTIYERELRDDSLSRQGQTLLEPSPLDLLCNKLRGRRSSWQDPVRGIASSPPTNTPILITDNINIDVPSEMGQGLYNNHQAHHHLSYGGAEINPPPPLGPNTVQQDVFMEPARLHGYEAFEDSYIGNLHGGSQTMQDYTLVTDHDKNPLTQGVNLSTAAPIDVDREMWVDVPSEMEQGLSNNRNSNNLMQTNYHYLSYENADNIPPPPFDSTVQRRVVFPESTRLPETIQDSIRGHLHAGNQTMQYHTSVTDDNNMLGNAFACATTQGINLTAAANHVVDCEMWGDGVRSDSGRSGFRPCPAEPAVLVVDTPTDRVSSINSTPLDGYNYSINSVLHDPSAYDPLLLTTNAMDSLNCGGLLASHGVVPNTADQNLCGLAAAFAEAPIWPLANSLVGTYFPNEPTWAPENSMDGIYFADEQTWTLENILACPTRSPPPITTSEIDAMISEMNCDTSGTFGSSYVDPLSVRALPPPENTAANHLDSFPVNP